MTSHPDEAGLSEIAALEAEIHSVYIKERLLSIEPTERAERDKLTAWRRQLSDLAHLARTSRLAYSELRTGVPVPERGGDTGLPNPPELAGTRKGAALEPRGLWSAFMELLVVGLDATRSSEERGRAIETAGRLARS